MPHEWDATTYDSLPLPHVAWGQRVLDRMHLRGDERVLDAGCGTGRDGLALLERWPGVRLVGIDGSAQMIDQARARLSAHPGVELHQADLTEPLPIEPVDAIMSVAAFHWVTDHDLLFRNLAASTRAGGRLTSDCGGQGQLAHLNAALVQVTGTEKWGVEFSGVHETEKSLRDNGWDVESVRLRHDPLRLEDPDLMETYLATVCLSSYVVDLTPEQAREFVREVRLAMVEPVIDYVRLEIDAVKTA